MILKNREKNILPQAIPRRKATTYANANTCPVLEQSQRSGVKLVNQSNSKKDRQYHSNNKKDKKTNSDLQNTRQTTKD